MQQKKYRRRQPLELRWNGQSHDSRGWMSQLDQAGRIWSGQEEELPSSLPAHTLLASEQTPWQARLESRRNRRERLWPRLLAECDGGCENLPAVELPVSATYVLRESRARYDVKSDWLSCFHRPSRHRTMITSMTQINIYCHVYWHNIWCLSIYLQIISDIRKEGQHAMNRDEGSYQLSHAYDRFLDMASFSRVKNRKNWVPASSDEASLTEVETSILGN